MTTVAIDIQPQFRFTCMAANATHFLLRPENMVNELNRQAALADKRVLIENVSIDPESICATVVNRNGVMFGRPSGFFSQCAGGCRGTHLLQGLPSPADYDHALELSGKHVHGACFYEANEANSTGLLEFCTNKKPILSLLADWPSKKLSPIRPSNCLGTAIIFILLSILVPATATRLKAPSRLSTKCGKWASLLLQMPKPFQS